MSTITIDGNNIPAGNMNGLTYKGFGVLSANSTSDLLLDYKAQQPPKEQPMKRQIFGETPAGRLRQTQRKSTQILR